MIEIERKLTDKQIQILQYLLKKAQPLKVYTVHINQDELAKELGMTRQALTVHLKKLRDFNLIRTGREFIDITEKALKLLRMSTSEAIVLVKVHPKYRTMIYEKIKEFPIEKAYRVAGEYDLIIITREAMLNDLLKVLANLEGVEDTKTFVTIEVLKE